MERALGIGGLFFRSDDPIALARWYRETLGIATFSEEQDGVWEQAAGPTVWAPFDRDTTYFGTSGQTWMVNLRVRDLDAMLAQLRAAGAVVHDEAQAMPGIGRFAWADDPEGNRFELWEPESDAEAEAAAAASPDADAPPPAPGPDR
jgi:predicted enzyme related to lactoylglutathione lyase